MKKRILLLGATGSIGLQTINVIDQHSDLFELVGIAAGHKAKELKQILDTHNTIQAVGISDVSKAEIFDSIKVYSGEDAMCKMIQDLDYDLLVNAVVGFRGLKPTLESLNKGIDVALANKESLVAGGVLVREQTLNHPNWSMGKRITVDSATMVNKGFEVIEAHYLFDLPYDQIDVVLHKQSIVHSMVEYNDNAIMAQLGSADMRLPIQYALMYPDRLCLKEDKPLDMTKTLQLDFKEMDFVRYPMLKLAYEIGRKEGNLGAVFNGADEQAVELFLEKKISFLSIEEAIQYAINTVEYIATPSLEQLENSDKMARKAVLSFAQSAHSLD